MSTDTKDRPAEHAENADEVVEMALLVVSPEQTLHYLRAAEVVDRHRIGGERTIETAARLLAGEVKRLRESSQRTRQF